MSASVSMSIVSVLYKLGEGEVLSERVEVSVKVAGENGKRVVSEDELPIKERDGVFLSVVAGDSDVTTGKVAPVKFLSVKKEVTPIEFEEVSSVERDPMDAILVKVAD